MIARACSLLIVCLLANNGGGVVGSPSAIGHPPLTPGQRLLPRGDRPALPNAPPSAPPTTATPPTAGASQQPARQPAAQPAPTAPAPDNGPFKLTVDAIMQGPKLVGYPPSGL